MELYRLTAHEAHDKLVKKEISSQELTEALYKRIEETEPKVKAYVTLDKEHALAQAAAVDAAIAQGKEIAPLAGVPGAIKDNISTKGLRTTCSSKMLANMVPHSQPMELRADTRRFQRRQCRCHRRRRSSVGFGQRHRRLHSSAGFF